MYAVFIDGGRQYKVEPGQKVQLDFRDVSAGDELRFDRVVAYSDGQATQLGRPTLEGATVTAKVVGVSQGPKLVVQKMRRRKNFRKKTGHRQLHIDVEIASIQGI
jgi:large subunit ribosomal protein L21